MARHTQSQTETVDLWSFVEGAIGFLSDVAHGGTRLILTVNGKEIGAVVPMEDLSRLQHNHQRKGDGL